MVRKLSFALGLGAGYVLGTRAGRAQYERMKSAASSFMEQPAVRERVAQAQAKVQETARSQGEMLADKAVDALKERLFGGPRTTPAQPAEQSPAVHVDDAQVRPVSH